MRISGFYPTYIYNTNYVSKKSLGKVDAIPDDALQGSKIGYADSSENTNPLRPGTSRDFAGILASQMAMGRMNATRLFRSQPSVQKTGAEEPAAQNINMQQQQRPDGAEQSMADMMDMLGA